ncbi:hypothetical protein [Amycolatopsis sp. NBC_00438]|uniref:hypothetical protein n=1 Tax=Amycolatopsis sp. NBC_00438 TaxID=2903558 RepID=UPI002E21BC62
MNDRRIADALAAMNVDQIVAFRADAAELSRSLEVPAITTVFCALSEVGYDEDLCGFTRAVTSCGAEEQAFVLALVRRAVHRAQTELNRDLWREIRTTVLTVTRQDRAGR